MPLKRARWLYGELRALDLLLLSALVLLTAPLWWAWLFPPPPPPFAYGAEPFPVRPAVLHPGDTPDLEVSRCNRTAADLTYTVSRVVQRASDSQQWYLPTIGAVAPPGCATVHSRAHTLPGDLTPGTYRLLFVATVQTERGTITAAGRSADFEVVGGER